ncbi:Hsp20/alpha crystallin family protein [Halorubrum sp. SD626R]|uniref:Hsp20/alpha crystallin family protein n=1 Tax=Halorubrum sp. SD626R TaxID=1419722 RepID=UPI000B853383|nr:Hsp20/alpha crystallin family protein [Halorubrum sp. SD626R]TKX81134.1 Hsp20/alpha crystallin family protein [Halorubrum sp. SD626R]
MPTPASSWTQGFDFPSRLFESGGNDYELYEEDDEFVLTVELPGFDPAEITASWDGGVLNIAAEHEDEERGTRRTYHRRFRFPRTVDEDGIEASYQNGILTVRLPAVVDAAVTGTEIEIES